MSSSEAQAPRALKTVAEVWASNVMSRDDILRLFPAPTRASRPVEAPERVLRQAKAMGRLPDNVNEWLDLDPARRPWLVLRGDNALDLEANVVATLADPRCGRPHETAALRRATDLLAAHDAAPRYGPGNGGSVIAAWARVDALAIGGLGREGPPPRCVPLLAELLERRLDACRCTILLETEPGRTWLGRLASDGASREDLRRITLAITAGASG